MKVKTIKAFRDLSEGIIRHVGTEFEVSEERYKELEERLPGFVSPVDEEGNDTANDAAVVDDPAEDVPAVDDTGKKDRRKPKKDAKNGTA